MVTFAVSKEKEEALRQKMESLGVYEKDIIEKFIRSSGKGGQKVNKTSTCVYLKHLPTAIEVKCQQERSQALNRFLARRILADKIERISYKENKDIIEKLVNITNFSRKIGLILGIIFVSISILVILNTVRLAIYTRTKEIEIMRLVGASEIFIRIPFIIEALLYALCSTVLSLFLIWLGLHFISPMITRYLGDVSLDMQGFFLQNIGWIFLLELLVSCIISVSCSVISMGKHLKI